MELKYVKRIHKTYVDQDNLTGPRKSLFLTIANILSLGKLLCITRRRSKLSECSPPCVIYLTKTLPVSSLSMTIDPLTAS